MCVYVGGGGGGRETARRREKNIHPNCDLQIVIYKLQNRELPKHRTVGFSLDR